MSLHTSLYEVKMKPNVSQLNDLDDWIVGIIKEMANRFEYGQLQAQYFHKPRAFFRLLFGSPDKSLVAVRSGSTISIDTHQHKVTSTEAPREESIQIEEFLGEMIGEKGDVNKTPVIVRGRKFWQYCETIDGRIYEYEVKETLFDAHSKYQHVEIQKTEEFGNILILDDEENLSEEDKIYTTTLCGLNRGVKYKDKNVLILGAGDGACLREIMKHSPFYITMIEIDEVVIDACRKHLRGCCGDALDHMEGPNHKIIIDDCVKWLDKFVAERTKFDIIVCDLTDIPIHPSIKSGWKKEYSNKSYISTDKAKWKFLSNTFNKCCAVLQQGGILLTHATSTRNKEGLRSFEQTLKDLNQRVTYLKYAEWVPSYFEKWVFYHITQEEHGENERTSRKT